MNKIYLGILLFSVSLLIASPALAQLTIPDWADRAPDPDYSSPIPDYEKQFHLLTQWWVILIIIIIVSVLLVHFVGAVKRETLKYMTIIAFTLSLIIGLLRIFCPALNSTLFTLGTSFETARLEVDSNKVIHLMFGIYCFVVCAFYFVSSFKLWKINSPNYKRRLKKSYFIIFLLALLLAVPLLCDIQESSFLDLVIIILLGLIISIVEFILLLLLPLSMLLFIIGLYALRYKKDKTKEQKIYLMTIFFTAVMFVLVGALMLYIFFSGIY